MAASDRDGAVVETREGALPGARSGLGRLRLPIGRGLASRNVALVASSLAALIGLSALAAWVLGFPLLAGWFPGVVQTKFNAALSFSLLGLSIAFSVARAGVVQVWVARACALIVIPIAGATLLEHVAGMDLGIDQAIFVDSASAAAPHPGRFAVLTAVAFLAAAAGILTLGRRFRGLALSEAFALVCGAIGAVSLFGYLYGAQALLSLDSASQVSLPASVALILLGVALIAADEDHGLAHLLADPGVGGQVLRRILPAAILVVPAGAWLRLIGERAGLYDETVGLSIMVAFEALLLIAVGVWTTARIQGVEERRRQAEADLIRLGAAASTPLIETAAVGLAVLDRDLRCLYVNPELSTVSEASPLASLGRRVDRVVPALGHETLVVLNEVLADGVAVRDLEISGEATPGGRTGTFLLSAEALRDGEDEIVGLTLSLVEITERKRREDVLREVVEMRGQAQAIDESIPFGIWIAEPDGRMTYLSESFLSMAGGTMQEAEGFGWIGFLASEVAEQTRRTGWRVSPRGPRGTTSWWCPEPTAAGGPFCLAASRSATTEAT